MSRRCSGGYGAAGAKGKMGMNVFSAQRGLGVGGAGSGRLCRGQAVWSADWTHTGHLRP